VEGPARMAAKLGPDFGVLVAAIIVEDHMNQLAGGDLDYRITFSLRSAQML
jgi:hypothetical protein